MTRHAPRTQGCKMVSPCPTNHSRQNSGQHSSNDDRLKAKQQCESGMRRSGSGNLRNLSKLRLVSRLPLYSMARWLAQPPPTAFRWVHSCLLSSSRLPSRTPLSELATEGQRHQLRPVLWKRMLTIMYYKRALSDFLPLTLQLILTHWISMKIQHAPPRCF